MITRYHLFFIYLISISNSTLCDIRLASASNFKPTLQLITKIFTSETGITCTISSASSGTLYHQIINGAPYDLFLSADTHYIERLHQLKLLHPDTRYIYAQGILVVAYHSKIDNEPFIEKLNNSSLISIANPNTAPYGKAALEVFTHLGFTPNFVTGNNVAHAYLYIKHHHVKVGVVSLSTLIQDKEHLNIQYQIIPKSLYTPIYQELALLRKHKYTLHAQKFIEFIKRDDIQLLIKKNGYL
jgi:molybdate transport system substrate-binding protein